MVLIMLKNFYVFIMLCIAIPVYANTPSIDSTVSVKNQLAYLTLETQVGKGLVFDMYNDGYKESQYKKDKQGLVGYFDMNKDNVVDHVARIIDSGSGFLLDFVGSSLKVFYDKKFKLNKVEMKSNEYGFVEFNYDEGYFSIGKKMPTEEQAANLEKNMRQWYHHANRLVKPFR